MKLRPQSGLHWWCSAFLVIFGLSLIVLRSNTSGVLALWFSYHIVPQGTLGATMIAAGILNLWASSFRLRLVFVFSMTPYLVAAYDYWFRTGSAQAAMAYLFLLCFQIVILDIQRRLEHGWLL